MIERTLAKRYAAALLKVTDAEGTTEQTEGLLLALKQAYEGLKSFRQVLAQPKVPRAKKKALFRKVFEKHAPRSFLEFLDLLVTKNRLRIIPDVAEMFDRLSDASHGIVRVKVRSWKPLSKKQQKGLHDRLVKMTGKKITLEAGTDASLKGGMLIRMGDSEIDGSVSHRLKVLGERLRDLQRA